MHIAPFGFVGNVERCPEIRPCEDLKRRGHNAEYRERLAIQQDRASHNGGTGIEPCLPEPLTQDNGIRLRFDIGWHECSSERGSDTEQIEESRRHCLAGNLLGDTGPAYERPRSPGDGRHGVERSVPIVPIREIQR